MGNVSSIRTARAKPKAIEFFAGIGLARMGLEKAGFQVAWANDYEPDKRDMYVAQFGDSEDHAFALGDVGKVDVADLPTDAALAWASSPCTDLSLAGGRAGLAGAQSGVFWHFVTLLKKLENNRPPVIVLENVTGLATSHGGDDLCAAITAFNDLGYSIDVVALDTRRFLPPVTPAHVRHRCPESARRHRRASLRAAARLPSVGVRRPEPAHSPRPSPPAPPAPKVSGLSALIEEVPPLSDERWWDADRTAAFAESLSPTQRARVGELKRETGIRYRTAYRRTRKAWPFGKSGPMTSRGVPTHGAWWFIEAGRRSAGQQAPPGAVDDPGGVRPVDGRACLQPQRRSDQPGPIWLR